MKKIIFLFLAFISCGVNAEPYVNVSFCTYQNDNCTKTNKPVSLSATEMKKLILMVASEKNNFIGFLDSEGTILQFYVDDLDKIWVEIPQPKEKGSYGIHINEKKMNEIILSLKAPYMKYKISLNLKLQLW